YEQLQHLKEMTTDSNQATNQIIEKIAPKLLATLEQWTAYEKMLTDEQKGMLHQQLSNGNRSNVTQLWGELLQTYQKRTETANQQGYIREAQVTSKDIEKWLSHHLKPDNQQTDKNVITRM